MIERIPVSILGATGAVGQRFVQLLAGHPWFEIAGLAASERSAGQRYADACRWVLDAPMPAAVREMAVLPISNRLPGKLVFSALPGDLAGPVEEELAAAGYAVCSNASAHRMDEDVPLVIPEVNPDHIALLDVQRRRRGWRGFIATNPNCSTTVLVMALAPLMRAFGLRRLHVVTLQALSGAGYPGVPSMDILDNILPYIGGEEGKMQVEPQKLLGRLTTEGIAPAGFVVSANAIAFPFWRGIRSAFRSNWSGRRHSRKSATLGSRTAVCRKNWGCPARRRNPCCCAMNRTVPSRAKIETPGPA